MTDNTSTYGRDPSATEGDRDNTISAALRQLKATSTAASASVMGPAIVSRTEASTDDRTTFDRQRWTIQKIQEHQRPYRRPRPDQAS